MESHKLDFLNKSQETYNSISYINTKIINKKKKKITTIFRTILPPKCRHSLASLKSWILSV